MTTNIQFVAAEEAGVSIPDGLRSYRFFVLYDGEFIGYEMTHEGVEDYIHATGHDINDPHLYFVYSR